MLVSPELMSEAKSLLTEERADVAIAPVFMYSNGQKLDYGSLCPDKPFMFRGGAHYFEAIGHSEALVHGCRTVTTKHSLIHNELKPFESYIESQLRYSNSLARRRSASKLSWRDYLRTTPVMMFASPIASYLFRGEIFSGIVGLGYALVRSIYRGNNNVRKKVRFTFHPVRT